MFSILYRILTKNRPRSLADDADIGLAFTYFWVLIPVDGHSCTGLAFNISLVQLNVNERPAFLFTIHSYFYYYVVDQIGGH